MPDTSQKTEKLLFGTLSVFLLALAFNFFTGEFRPTQSVSAKDGEQSGEPSEPSKQSDDDQSEDKDDADEKSVDDEDSVDDVSVKPAAKSTAKTTTQMKTQEDSIDDLSVKSTDDVSVETENEMSVKSSDGDGDSEVSSANYETVVQKAVVAESKPETETVKVTREEKLFFVLPVEVESEVVLNKEGAVVSERKDFINWLKSIFSL